MRAIQFAQCNKNAHKHEITRQNRAYKVETMNLVVMVVSADPLFLACYADKKRQIMQIKDV